MSDVSVTLENCKTNTVVRRGKDWVWKDQDHKDGRSDSGIIIECEGRAGPGLAGIKWDGGQTNNYRIGFDNAYDLYLGSKGISIYPFYNFLLTKKTPG